jgi:hypothetical protein
VTTTINGKKWCRDPKSGGWICAEQSGNCDADEGLLPSLGRLIGLPMGRLARRLRARNMAQETFWPPSAGYGTGQYGRQSGPNRSLNQSRIRTKVTRATPRSEADQCFEVCCSLHEPSGSDCKGDGKVTQPGTWSCLKRCLKMPDPQAPSPGRPRGWCGAGEHLCAKKTPGGSSNFCCCDSTGECVGGKIVLANPRRVQNGCYRPGRVNHPGRAVVACRMGNPGPNGEALSVPPFCAPGDCTSKGCGPCDWNQYSVPGAVDDVFQAMDQSELDVEFAMQAANEGLRDMYRVPYRSPWADPSVAILSKPGGPPPQNPMSTGQWDQCMRGPAVVAYPSSYYQQVPGGYP